MCAFYVFPALCDRPFEVYSRERFGGRPKPAVLRVRTDRAGACMQKEVALTPEGQIRLEQELIHLETVRRREVGERIKEAKEFGDISENSEYDDAKNEQAWVESRILEINQILAHATIIHSPKRRDKVTLGSRSSCGTPRRATCTITSSSVLPRRTPAQQDLERIAGRQGGNGRQEGDVVRVQHRVAASSSTKSFLSLTSFDDGPRSQPEDARRWMIRRGTPRQVDSLRAAGDEPYRIVRAHRYDNSDRGALRRA